MPVEKIGLNRLVIYRNITNKKIVKKVINLLNKLDTRESITELQSMYYEIYFKLIKNAEQKRFWGHLWQNYLIELIARDENIFSLCCERGETELGDSFIDIVVHDIKILKDFYKLDWNEIKNHIEIEDGLNIENFYPGKESLDRFGREYNQKCRELGKYFEQESSHASILEHMMNYYSTVGCGDLARYPAFYWDEGLVGIPDPDPIQLDDLIGYKHQKEILVRNTESFIRGKRANNVLLYGEKGTGKSSSVKALLNKYADEGLRMIELSKEQLVDFNKIIRKLRGRGHQFIIFMDDLSFEEFETEYKYIKALIEGGLQKKPKNVLIYVTSNRKHLIKETWKDRESANDEVMITDSVEEKLSLADRFGIVITYMSPGQKEYLKIVQELAKKNRVNIPEEELKEKAIQWEMKYHGRSGRTAHQFIDHLLGTL